DQALHFLEVNAHARPVAFVRDAGYDARATTKRDECGALARAKLEELGKLLLAFGRSDNVGRVREVAAKSAKNVAVTFAAPMQNPGASVLRSKRRERRGKRPPRRRQLSRIERRNGLGASLARNKKRRLCRNSFARRSTGKVLLEAPMPEASRFHAAKLPYTR